MECRGVHVLEVCVVQFSNFPFLVRLPGHTAFHDESSVFCGVKQCVWGNRLYNRWFNHLDRQVVTYGKSA